MKKIATLFLIAALFYNVLGFYVVFAMQQEQVWITSIEDTDCQNFKVFKFNINPYGYIVDSGFESANEDFAIDGKIYHVFKKRIQNNVLKFYCLNNEKSAVSSNLKKLVDNQLFDSDSKKENSNKKLLKCLIKDYVATNNDSLQTVSVKVDVLTTLFLRDIASSLRTGHYTLNYPPPNMI